MTQWYVTVKGLDSTFHTLLMECVRLMILRAGLAGRLLGKEKDTIKIGVYRSVM